MVLVTNTPKNAKEIKTAKPRTPLPTLKCDVGDCPYTCKYGKHMRTHKSEAHGVNNDESVMDASVNASDLDITRETESQEEAKVHNSMDGHPHSTLNIEQTCPLDGDRKRKSRPGDDDDEGEDGEAATKKERVEESVEIIENEDEEPKSPDTRRRQRIMEEAKLSVEYEKQKHIDAQQRMVMAMLDSTDSDKSDNTNLNEVTGMDQSQSLLEDHEGTIVLSGDSLSQTQTHEASALDVIPAEQSTQPDGSSNEIVAEIQAELDAKTKSLEDAISERNTLDTMLAQEIANRKQIEMKLAKAKAELKANEEVVINLQAALKNPAPSPDAAAEIQDKLKQIKKLTEDNRVLNAKTEDQKKVIDRLKKQLADAKACAEKERVAAQGYEHRVNQLTGDINQLKGLTYCKNEACPNEKTCGRSHSRKEENRKDCKFWLEGYCRREQRCNLRHDVEARTRAWDAENAAGGNGNNTNSNHNNSGKTNHPNCNSSCNSNHTGNQNKQKNPKKPSGKQGQGQANRGCQQHSCSHTSHTHTPHNTAPPPPLSTQDKHTINPSATPPPQPQAPITNHNQQAPLSTTAPPSSQAPQFMTPIPPIGMLPGVQMPSYNPMMTNSMMGWGGINPGINVAQLTAMQAQSMTRLQRMEEVRVEINRVREQINSAREQHQGQGSSELQTLIAKEKELTTQLNLV